VAAAVLLLAANLASAQSDAQVDALIDKLVAALKQAQVVDGPQAGSFRGEMPGVHAGGVSTLATYALLAAGVSPYDPVIERAIGFLEEHPLPGTYSRSLRAATWSHLIARTGESTARQRYQRALRTDVKWLTDALREDGYYGYDAEGTGGDHSCSQFGVLGVWAARMIPGPSPIEVSLNYWERVRNHWLAHQDDDGSWSYSGAKAGSVTMTTAGINTLYILAAEYLTQKEPVYSRLRGVARRDEMDNEVKRLFDAADRGFAWLKSRSLLDGGGYQLFGLERLGVASGRKVIGGVDWYRAGAASVRGPSGDVVEDAFSLLFLVYGRAPVLMAKLRYGEGQGWNRYYRDLHFLTSYLSGRYERIFKWQIVDADEGLDDLLDAPILVISGEYGLDLTGEQRTRLLDYVDAGGTIIGHADHGNDRFTASFRQLCAEWFADRGGMLKPLAADHPLYTASGGGGKAWAQDYRIEGVDDGVRTCVFLFPNDLAGAWHQNRQQQHPDVFALMSNMTEYAGGEYDDLPRRLRPPLRAGPGAKPLGYLTVDTRFLGGRPLQTTGKWLTVGGQLAHASGVYVLAACPPPATAGAAEYDDYGKKDEAKPRTPASLTTPLRPSDVLHVTGTAAFNVDDGRVDELAGYVQRGGFIWLEAAGGDEGWVRSAAALMDAVSTRIGGEVRPVERDHVLLAGRLPGLAGEPTTEAAAEAAALRPNRWGLVRLRGGAPPMRTLEKDGRTVAVLTPFDTLATAAGHRVWGAPAYAAEPTLRLVSRLLLLRYLDVTGTARTAGALPTRPASSLVAFVRTLIVADRFGEAVEWTRAIERLDPDADGLTGLRGELRSRMLAAFRAARADGRDADAARLARQVTALFPDDLRGLWLAEQERGGPIDRPADAPADLPAGLADIEVVFGDQTTNARWLLQQWQQQKEQYDALQKELADAKSELDALDARARELIRQQARSGRGGARGGGEFDKIAAQRKLIETQARKTERAANESVAKMNRITRALAPHEDAIARLGWIVRDGVWMPKAQNDTAPPAP